MGKHLENPFLISDEQLRKLISHYLDWLNLDPEEAKYPGENMALAEKIKIDFLDTAVINSYSHNELDTKVLDYSRKLEGPVHIKLGKQRIRENITNLRRTFDYINSSDDSPFEIAQNVLDGAYKIEVFAKAFWSPVLQAKFPEVLPNWNNKTERFLKKLGVNLSTSRLTIAEKYKLLSDSFVYLASLSNKLNFFNINHLMHYGTEIEEGKNLIDKMLRNDPVVDMIQRYKKVNRETKMADEIYKWRLAEKYHHRPDTNAPSFNEEYKGVDYSNLIYHNAKGVGLHIAMERPEEFREAFKKLFDESVDLQERVVDFSSDTLAIYRKIWPVEGHSHHQDERTISVYLAFYDANKYPIYKDSFYRKYCELIGEKVKTKGKKYIHYLQLLNDFIAKYILPDEELLALKKSYIPEDGHKDQSHYILAQDILYQMLDQRRGDSKRYWRIGTTDNGRSIWEQMARQNVISIGWEKTGDLNDYDINNKNDIAKIFRKVGYYADNNQLRSKQASQVYNFYANINSGDVVVAQDGATVKGVGIVTDEYTFIADETFSHTRAVEWILKNPVKLTNPKGLQTTVYELKEQGFIKQLEEIIKNRGTGMDKSIAINQILYGPPGTGKTYKTVSLAAKIIMPEREAMDDSEALRVFNENLGERIEFITFHQSYSYEDFIQGLRPDVEDDDKLSFERKDGVFARIAVNALFEYYIRLKKLKPLQEAEQREIDVNEIYLDFVEYLKKLESKEFNTASGSVITISGFTKNDNIEFKHYNRSRSYLVSGKRLLKLFEVYPDITKINSLHSEIRDVIGGCNTTVYWVALKEFITFYNNYEKPDAIEPAGESEEVDYETKKKLLSTVDLESLRKVSIAEVPNYVIIIDEINRANISRVFGELITLIEADKRSHGNIPLTATLPSGESFIVPSNLYLIGTMNTADKSIALVDIALRRRFEFVPVYPNYGLVSDGREVLQKINAKIIDLKGYDFQVGHAYFMTENFDLVKCMNSKIIPLLLEYFLNDAQEVKGILEYAGLEISDNGWPLMVR